MTPNDLYQASQWACNGRGLLIVIWKWIVKMLTSTEQGQQWRLQPAETETGNEKSLAACDNDSLCFVISVNIYHLLRISPV